ncbi:MAG: hypothetical protein VXZ41_03820 [Pseudomonadota bacterium]|nr:hypothetical protein [Pseudomonadota bacterium]
MGKGKKSVGLAVMLALATMVGMSCSGVVAAAPVDLTGTYDVATLTPLERPKMFGNKQFLTREEAARISRDDAALKAARNNNSDPNRGAPPAGGDGSSGAAGNVGGYNTFWIDNGNAAFELDGKFRTSILTQPENGRRPELTAAAKAKFAQLRRSRRGNSGTAWWQDEQGKGAGPYDDMELRPLAERCILGFGPTAGPPIFPTLYNNLKRIVQTKDSIMILAEMVHDARIVRLNSAHRPDHMRTWLGDSVGHWEGDTLVVKTKNFTPRPGLYGADENLQVTERFRRVDDATLSYSFVVDNPTVWSEPWGGEYPWPATTAKVYEYACHEGNYALGNIMRGARLLEAEALQANANKAR